MTAHFEELETLIAEYDAIHGKGKAWEIFGSLLLSHGILGLIQVFRRAKGREIAVEDDFNAPDLVVVRYCHAQKIDERSSR